MKGHDIFKELFHDVPQDPESMGSGFEHGMAEIEV
jgi:hypothetical protein